MTFCFTYHTLAVEKSNNALLILSNQDFKISRSYKVILHHRVYVQRLVIKKNRIIIPNENNRYLGRFNNSRQKRF